MREHAWVIGLADGIGWSGCEKGLGRRAKTFEWRRIRDFAKSCRNVEIKLF